MQYVSELLSDKGRKVYSIHPRALVIDAVREMDARKVGSLAVVEEGRLVGVITERDYARRGILRGKRSDETYVEVIMTRDVVTITQGASIDECMEIMTMQRVRHLPVLQDGELLGIISIGDLVRAIMQRQTATIAHLRDYIAG